LSPDFLAVLPDGPEPDVTVFENNVGVIEDNIAASALVAVLAKPTGAVTVPNCTGCAVCFWRPLVLTRPKLRVHFAQLSELQKSRSRFR
jgi:hypothetical protein